jgi:hypothetical protein
VPESRIGSDAVKRVGVRSMADSHCSKTTDFKIFHSLNLHGKSTIPTAS